MKKDNTGFFERVYEVVMQIPYGRVSSYGAIATYLGSASSARMVGWAMNQSHSLPYYVPAHRVVNRNGMLTGKHHFGGSNIMADMLKSEGIILEGDSIQNFHEKFWDPSVELRTHPFTASLT